VLRCACGIFAARKKRISFYVARRIERPGSRKILSAGLGSPALRQARMPAATTARSVACHFQPGRFSTKMVRRFWPIG
jgi:hypothetical protein